ncbi:MAG: radical SAM protein [archaeon]
MIEKAYYSLMKNQLKRPVYLIYFVTNRCNSRCEHCFYSKQLNIAKNKDLSLGEIEKFSKQLGKLVWLSFSGGEPFLREDIAKVYEIFLRNNNVSDFTIPTNGMLPDVIYEKTREMLQLGKVKSFSLNLSLDGTKQIHNKIRGVNCYDLVFKTYYKVVGLKKEFPYFSIKVSTTLSNKNIGNIKELHEEITKRMPEINFHNFEIMRGDPKNPEYKTPTPEELEKNKELIFSIWEKYNFYGKRISSKIAMKAKKELFNTYINILRTKKQPFRCYAGIVHLVLDNQGDVYLCELLGKVGNIREKNLEEIWKSTLADHQRKMVKEGRCYCTHSCFQNTNLVFNLKNWPKIIM